MLRRVTEISPTWCPGCGNYAILGAVKAALDQLSLAAHQVVFVYDIGCSGNMADFVFAYGFHGLHGRVLPLAAGIKLANHGLKVICIIGDGGCYGEGVSHFIGLMKANHDITVIAHNNFLYSLTTGQKSPTTPKGQVTPSTPFGNPEEPFNPLAVALVNHATFVSRGFAGDIPHLTKLLVKAIDHTGFGLVDVLQPCLTYNKTRPYSWYRKNLNYLDKIGHDPSNFDQALKQALNQEKLAVGLFYQQKKPAFHELILEPKAKPLVDQPIESIDISRLLGEFK